MYLPFVLKFYNFRSVRVKLCGIDTVNGTLRMEWGFENELTESELIWGTSYLSFPRG